MANSKRIDETTAKTENIEEKKEKTPKSNGVYSLVNIG
jgi:hypothetical protein